jgi:pimeloyl-ACP methyl ester carboxylesterase
VVFLHGGLANASYWGLQVAAVARQHRVIVLDTRGHGRSTRDDQPFRYDLLADDVVAVLDAIGIDRAAVVGWSDGAIIGLDLAMRHPARISKLFAYAANTDRSGLIPGASRNPTVMAYTQRTASEYQALSATPWAYAAFVNALEPMWATQPNWPPAQLAAIRTPVLVADGDHDEIVRRSHAERIAAAIPRSDLLILPGTSHFAFLQDPGAFTSNLLRFLSAAR